MSKKPAKPSQPKLEQVAELAMRLGGQHLAEYGSARSRQDFTQRQLMSCLILRAYLKTTYRGLLEILAGHGRLRTVLGMEEKLPHFTTLQKFSARSRVLEIADALIARIGQAALRRQAKVEEKVAVAIDATGMETTVASAHFVSRAGRQRHGLGGKFDVVAGHFKIALHGGQRLLRPRLQRARVDAASRRRHQRVLVGRHRDT